MSGGVENAPSNVQFDDGSIGAGGRKLALFHGALSLACDMMILFLFTALVDQQSSGNVFPRRRLFGFTRDASSRRAAGSAPRQRLLLRLRRTLIAAL